MIGRLRGILCEKNPPEVLLEVGGVGYEVQLPMSCFYQLPETGEETILYTHFVVREDAQLLFGFSSHAERALFRELIKTNGVGPKLALTVLSGMNAEQLLSCIQNEQVAALVKLPGVGRKTAERLVMEMKDRLDKFTQMTPSEILADDQPRVSDTFVHADASEDAISALVALGYKPQQAQRAVAKVQQPDMSSESLIREALKSMV